MKPGSVSASTGPKLGLIVNPLAGLGGRVGLKGSDGRDVQERALALGAQPLAGRRAVEALARLAGAGPEMALITPPGEMGGNAAREIGFEPELTGDMETGRPTTALDTRRAAEAMVRRGADLILFAGGDGTARDVFDAVGADRAVLGIPAGVKMHSAVYAVNPARAGELASDFLTGRVATMRRGEVMDLDEEALRRGQVNVRLYGYLNVPFERRRLQSLKTASPPVEAAVQAEIGRRLAGQMSDDGLYVIGPGTTTQAVLDALGLKGTLIGVDVVHQGRLLARDVGEAALLELIPGRRARVVLSLIGGQGFLFGRGNQQISPAVLKHIQRRDIIVVAAPQKLQSLAGRPLLVDTGDSSLDRRLAGYIKIVTGAWDETVYRVSA